MDHPGPYVLIGINALGKPIEVGIYDNERDMRLYVAKHTREGCRYSVWTPDINTTIAAPAVVGLRFAPSD